MNNQVPVLLVIFNRPEKTRKVVEALRQVKPARLFVAADGPRSGHTKDFEKCCLTRQVISEIDWPCECQTKFLDNNAGCDPHVVSAIEWFFEYVENGIIFEDDCVPHPHFFSFCDELFKRYADDERIMQISGFSPYSKRKHGYDYHFSRAFRCGGGWGTWRRAWNYFTTSMRSYNDCEAMEILKAYFPNQATFKIGYKKFCQFREGLLNNWDFQWNMACYAQNGLCLVPEKNLITNIGFDEDATHTQKIEPMFANLEGHSIKFPMRHPKYVYADSRPEQALQKELHCSLPLKSRIAQRVRHALGMLSDFWETTP